MCVSRNVFNQAKDKLDLTAEEPGEKKVKDIVEPVMVYRDALNGSNCKEGSLPHNPCPIHSLPYCAS